MTGVQTCALPIFSICVPMCPPDLDLCVLIGDVNDDGQVNVLDIVLTTNLILCQDCPDDYNACSDMNGDGELNVLDIVLIVNLILN